MLFVFVIFYFYSVLKSKEKQIWYIFLFKLNILIFSIKQKIYNKL